MAKHNPAVAAIEFALTDDEGMTFLRCWMYGDFEVCRREWPEAPEAVYISADPLMPERCHAARDGECHHKGCPQLRDGEPKKTGRHCPLDTEEDES